MDEIQKIKLFGTRDFSENFDMTLSFIKQNYAAIFKPLCILIPVLLIAVYFIPNTQSMDLTGYNDPMDMYRDTFTLGFFLAYFLMGLVSYLVYLYVVSYMAIYAKSDDGIVKSSDVWSKVKSVFLPVLGGSIIFGILVCIGTLFCIIPGVIVYVYLGFYMYAYINDETGIIDSFQRSYELVKGNWFITFGFGLVFLILLSILGAVFAIPTYIAMVGRFLEVDFLTSDIYMYMASLISGVGGIMIYPILYIAMGVMYYSHRNQIEGVDMESEIDNIGTLDNNKNTQY